MEEPTESQNRNAGPQGRVQTCRLVAGLYRSPSKAWQGICIGLCGVRQRSLYGNDQRRVYPTKQQRERPKNWISQESKMWPQGKEKKEITWQGRVLRGHNKPNILGNEQEQVFGQRWRSRKTRINQQMKEGIPNTHANNLKTSCLSRLHVYGGNFIRETLRSTL